MRWRTPLAAAVILVSLTIYVPAASFLADMLPQNRWLGAIYYFFAGIAWLPPVIWVMGWAHADPNTSK